jgi:hypothetical protein
VIILLNPANSDAHSTARELTESLARVLFALKSRPRNVLVHWLSQLPADVLGGRCIRPLQQHLTKYVEVCSLPADTHSCLLSVTVDVSSYFCCSCEVLVLNM